MSNKTIQGFYVLPLKFSASSSSHHELFIKEHVVRHQSRETPAGCTLFVLNVPPYATEDSFTRVFSVAAGPVNKVIFKKQPNINATNINGFKVAYVVFTKAQSLIKCLQLTSLNALSTPEKPIICGIEKWVSEYNQSIPDPKVLQNEINQFMSAHDKQTEEQKKQEQMAGEEDEDGWITVTKHGRNPGLSRKEIKFEEDKKKINALKQARKFKPF
ncbi:uncharacterized protein CBL_11159 [Carabus blaptoides fortunei]